jgi:hypothetical protein
MIEASAGTLLDFPCYIGWFGGCRLPGGWVRHRSPRPVIHSSCQVSIVGFIVLCTEEANYSLTETACKT